MSVTEVLNLPVSAVASLGAQSRDPKESSTVFVRFGDSNGQTQVHHIGGTFASNATSRESSLEAWENGHLHRFEARGV